jgi:glycine dehydrogenase
MLMVTAFTYGITCHEQHIKREKQLQISALLRYCCYAGMFAVYHGPKGLNIRTKYIPSAATLADALNKLGIYQTNTAFFDTIAKADAQK